MVCANFLFFSSKWCLQSSLLNKLGAQTFRIKLADKALLKRRKIQIVKQEQAGVHVQRKILKASDELDQNGLIKVKSALPQEFFSQAKNLAELMKTNKINCNSFVKSGAEYRELAVRDVAPELNKFLEDNFWINNCVKSYLAKQKLPFLWRIKLVRDYDETFDKNTLFHADTYFSTLKAFIYLDRVTKEEDVYNYLLGSHVMTPEILSLHKIYATQYNDSPWPKDNELSELNFKRFLEDIEPNTLILSDTRGLHRRNPKHHRSKKWRATLFCSFRSTPFRG